MSRLERFDCQAFAREWWATGPGERAGWYLVYTPPLLGPALRYWVPKWKGVFTFPPSRWLWLGENSINLPLAMMHWQTVVQWELDEAAMSDDEVDERREIETS